MQILKVLMRNNKNKAANVVLSNVYYVVFSNVQYVMCIV